MRERRDSVRVPRRQACGVHALRFERRSDDARAALAGLAGERAH